MDLIIALICEYIFNELECIEYLNFKNVNHVSYECIYKKYDIDDYIEKKKVRKLKDVRNDDLKEYHNLLSISFRNSFNEDVSTLYLPNTVTKLVFGQEFNKGITNLNLSNLSYIRFGGEFNNSVPTLPDTLTHLIFGFNFNKNINNLPKNIIHLEFGCRFNKKISLQSLNKLETLCIGMNFRQKVKLPNSIKHLEWDCNIELPKLPTTLTQLELGFDFNKKLPNPLPSELTHLTLGLQFEHFIESFPDKLTYLTVASTKSKISELPCGLQILEWLSESNIPKLPNALIELKTGHYFNEKIELQPLNNLRHLEFGHRFNQNVDDLSHNITHLEFGCMFNQKLSFLPNKLTKLVLGDSYNKKIPPIPDTLIHLEFGKNYNQKLPLLSPALEILIFGDDYDHYIPIFPPKLKVLIFGKRFNQEINCSALSDLTMLAFGQCFNSKSIRLPNNLKELKFGDNFNKNIVLPTELIRLVFGDNFNKKIILPNKLEHAEFGDKFNFELNLPVTLTYLKFGDCYNKRLPTLPNKLKYLQFGKEYNHYIDKYPTSIKTLIFGIRFDQTLPNILNKIEMIIVNKKHKDIETLKLKYGNKIKTLQGY